MPYSVSSFITTIYSILRLIEASEFTYEPKRPQDVVGIVPEKRTCSTEDEQWEIALSDKEIDMKLTVTVYSASFKKLAILNTLERTVSTIMHGTIGFFKPLDFISGLSEVSPVADGRNSEATECIWTLSLSFI